MSLSHTAADLLFARAFSEQCRRWALENGADAASAETARQAGWLLVQAERQGHVCLDMASSGLPASPLIASGLARDLSADLRDREIAPKKIALAGYPMTLDAQGRLYLTRYFTAETRLAAALLARHRNPPPPPSQTALTLLSRLFPVAPDPDEQQKRAVESALARRLFIVSGGPGTGKTSVIARLLACLLADAPALRVALAAPTGKAAARMQESLRERAQELPPEIAARLPNEAATLHRLLGISSHGERPRYHAENPLPVDALIVDEASMLDVLLAEETVSALSCRARLIFLGDPSQLQAVEAGSFFSRLVALATPEEIARGAEKTQLSPLSGAGIRLRKSYRFAADSPLGRLAAACASGDIGAAEKALASGGDSRIIPASASALTKEERAALEEGYAGYREALSVWRPGTPPDLPFAAFNAFRALAVVRESERGARRINLALEQTFRAFSARLFASLPFSETFFDKTFFPGQAIMVTENARALSLFNGDVGLLLPESAADATWSLRAFFPAVENSAAGNWRSLDPARLPAHEGAFAMTAHKAQGSEFSRVALVLPEKDSPLLTRELLYTAVTRARKSALILGNPQLFFTALSRAAQRLEGFQERLLEADRVGAVNTDEDREPFLRAGECETILSANMPEQGAPWN
ncbi:MAG: exodeoxyribonuclease V subunit alpha [Zoogloeaceae bacterium]|jgi:exodeoxyribonuclease V alpha subunit|nr:exodeoxyribonuclease V subunit alpha [Zoogloeaceae bacterium]